MPYHIPIIIVAGLAIGLGAAIYANRDNIRSFAEQKKLQWQLENARKNRELETKTSDSGDSHIPLQEMHADDDNDDSNSIDTAEFLSQDVTNYYSSGQTSSAVDYDTANEESYVRRRSNMTASQPLQVPSLHTQSDYYQSYSAPQPMSPISTTEFGDTMSLHSLNSPDFLSSPEPSLDSRSESFDSDMSWGTDSFSDIEQPSGSEIDIMDDERSLMRN